MIIKRVGGNPQKVVRAVGAQILEKLGRESVRAIRHRIGKSSPSKPGDPPASVTGRLKKSVAYELRANGTQLRVGFKEAHGKILDVGTKSPIVPIRARALALRLNDGTTIFRMRTKGTKARPVIDVGVKAAMVKLKIDLITTNSGRSPIGRL